MEKTKKVYIFTPDTGEFVQEGKAYLNPRRSQAEKKPVFALPANSTFEIPPDKEPETALIFNKTTGKWDVLPDFRGIIFYNIETGEQYRPDKINEKPEPDVYTRKAPPSRYHKFDGKARAWKYTEVDKHITARKMDIDAAYIEAVGSAFEYESGKWIESTGLQDYFNFSLLCKQGEREWVDFSLIDASGEEIPFKDPDSYIVFYGRFLTRNIDYINNANKLKKILKKIKDTDFSKKP